MAPVHDVQGASNMLDTATLCPHATKTLVRQARLLPSTGWKIDMARVGSQHEYLFRFEPPPGAQCTQHGCLAVCSDARDLQATCAFHVLVDTRGMGSATATCPRHGDKQLSWSEAVDYAHELVASGILDDRVLDDMIHLHLKHVKEARPTSQLEQWLAAL